MLSDCCQGKNKDAKGNGDTRSLSNEIQEEMEYKQGNN